MDDHRASARGGPRHLSPTRGTGRRRLVRVVLVMAIIAAAAAGVTGYLRDDETDASGDAARPDADAGAAPGDEISGGGDGAAGGGEGDGAPAAPSSGFATPGLLTFRGSPTRSYYGEGPVPTDPEVLWTYPDDGGMCAESTVGEETPLWCGTGWTGQPAVFERDGRTWVVFGAYDRMVHFVDYHTGEDILPPFPTGDIIKGSVSVDPDGFPLVYTGSRDNRLRVIAIDRPQAEELWSLDAHDVSPTRWNDDWDGSPLILDDVLYEGGENSQFHIVQLNRSNGSDGLVQVAPELVFNAPGWDEELTAALGGDRPNDVSIESSVAYHEGVVYFANSGGLVQGWDVSGLAEGREPTRAFRFWVGDDVDASVVVDGEGFLYVAVENDRGTVRGQEVGQLLKLDPSRPDQPLVWSLPQGSGFWATPALHDYLVIAPADDGTAYGVDRATGEVRWTVDLPGPTWQSPVVVDDVWVQGDCDGVLHAYDVADTTTEPRELWSVELEGCIESTPALWHGRLFVGTRAGSFHAVGDP
jgi:outer membrane protein assembly factor BamB